MISITEKPQIASWMVVYDDWYSKPLDAPRAWCSRLPSFHPTREAAERFGSITDQLHVEVDMHRACCVLAAELTDDPPR